MKTTQTVITRYLRPGMFPGITFEPSSGDENPGAADNADTVDTEDESVEFTPSQQKAIQALINANTAKERKRAEAERTRLIEQMKGKDSENPKNPKEKNDSKDSDEKTITLAEFKRLQTEWEKDKENEVTNYKSQVTSLLSEKKRAAVISAAARMNVVDAEVVSRLVDDQIAFDDEGKIFIAQNDGSARIGKKGDYMTVDEFLGEYLSDKPYLVKANASGGGGSSPKPGKGSSTADSANLSPLDKIRMGRKSSN